MIWEPGDFFEVVPGVISFTQSKTVRIDPVHSTKTMNINSFFFDATDGRWSGHEWNSILQNQIPNGPALLVVLRRGDRADAFGAVSVINGAWTLGDPLFTLDLYQSSAVFKRMKLMSSFLVAWMLIGLCIMAVLPSFRNKFHEIKGRIMGVDTDDALAAARGLMHKVARNTQSYWSDNSRSSGKL